MQTERGLGPRAGGGILRLRRDFALLRHGFAQDNNSLEFYWWARERALISSAIFGGWSSVLWIRQW